MPPFPFPRVAARAGIGAEPGGVADRLRPMPSPCKNAWRPNSPGMHGEHLCVTHACASADRAAVCMRACSRARPPDRRLARTLPALPHTCPRPGYHSQGRPIFTAIIRASNQTIDVIIGRGAARVGGFAGEGRGEVEGRTSRVCGRRRRRGGPSSGAKPHRHNAPYASAYQALIERALQHRGVPSVASSMVAAPQQSCGDTAY